MVIVFQFLPYVFGRFSSGVQGPFAPLGRIQVLIVVDLQVSSTRLWMSVLQI